MVYKEKKNMSYACLKSETQNPRYGFRFRVMPYISYKHSHMKKLFRWQSPISITKKVNFFLKILEVLRLQNHYRFLRRDLSLNAPVIAALVTSSITTVVITPATLSLPPKNMRRTAGYNRKHGAANVTRVPPKYIS